MREENRQKQTNPFLWFIFAIVIPITLAATIIILILSIAGVNVGEWMKKTGSNIPIVSSVIKTEEEKNAEQIEERAKVTIAKKDEEIEKLNTTINDLEGTVSQLEQTILKLENQIASSEQELQEEQLKEAGNHEEIKQMSASFRNMKSKQAANILTSLEDDIAVAILKELSNDVRGKIFEAMDPERAAKLTKMFIDE